MTTTTIDRDTCPRRDPTFRDRVALWILKLAKLRRTPFRSTESEDYEAFYEQFYVERDVDAYIEDQRMVLRRDTINAALGRYLSTGASLLDVGCGLGDVLHGAPRELGLKLHGFDFAASNVKWASSRLAGRAEIKQGSIYEIPFADASMDAAVCLEVLEHIEDDRRGFRDIARVVKPGGIFIIAVPYNYFWPDYQRLIGHFRHYTRQAVESRLREAGFEPVEHLPNYPNWADAYTLAYPAVRLKHMVFGRFVGSKDLYHFKWPWSRRTTMEKVLNRLKHVEESDRRLDYSKLDTSTFIVARRTAAGNGDAARTGSTAEQPTTTPE